MKLVLSQSTTILLLAFITYLPVDALAIAQEGTSQVGANDPSTKNAYNLPTEGDPETVDPRPHRYTVFGSVTGTISPEDGKAALVFRPEGASPEALDLDYALLNIPIQNAAASVAALSTGGLPLSSTTPCPNGSVLECLNSLSNIAATLGASSLSSAAEFPIRVEDKEAGVNAVLTLGPDGQLVVVGTFGVNGAEERRGAYVGE